MNVSVIIPFWNGGQWIERAVASVADQTTAPNEFFVVNDGSRLEERARLVSLAAQYGFVILDKENGGQGSARNHGVAHSQSEYICFLDQDDFFLPDHVERLGAFVQGRGPNFGFAYGSYDLADAQGVVHVKNDLARNWAGLHPPSRDPIELFGRNLSILPSASIISKRAFQAIGGFDVQFRGYEDDDLFSRMILAGFEYAHLPESVYVWCQHKGSTTWSPTMARSRFDYYRKIRAANLLDGRLMERALADAMADRFGRFFYKSAALALGSGRAPSLDMEIFQAYMQDVVRDNLSPGQKHIFRLRAWLLEHTGLFPLSVVWALKRLNRQRIDARRLRDGRQFLE